MLKVGQIISVRFLEGTDERPYGHGLYLDDEVEVTCYPKGTRRQKCLDGEMWECEVRSSPWKRQDELCVDVKPLRHQESDELSARAYQKPVRQKVRRIVWPMRQMRE